MSLPQLDSLDDNVLLHIFSHLDPLPDLFNAAASCRVRVEPADCCPG